MKDVGQRSDRMTEVAGLKHALPYLRLFQVKTFVVKLSGPAPPLLKGMAARWFDPHRLPVPPTGYVRAVNPTVAP